MEFEQQLLQSKMEVQEITFEHIAKELHDNVGQLLSTTKMLLGITELNWNPAPDTLVTANATLAKAIDEMRHLSRSLDKEWLQQFNFIENLNTTIARINAGGSITATLFLHDDFTMEGQEQIIIFRVVQEAIQNAIRHANPTSIKVNGYLQGEEKVLTISNNGKMLPENFKGMGSANMQQRAKLFGGKVQWTAGEQETVVTIYIPIKHQGNEN